MDDNSAQVVQPLWVWTDVQQEFKNGSKDENAKAYPAMVQLSPDGQMCAVSGNPANFLVHDFTNNEDLLIKNPPARSFKDVARMLWHPTKTCVIVVDGEGNVFSDDIKEKKSKKMAIKNASDFYPINKLAFSKNGKLLIAGLDVGTSKSERYQIQRPIKVWNMDEQKLEICFNGPSYAPHPLREELIAYGQENGIVSLYNIETGKEERGFRKDQGNEDEPSYLSFNANAPENIMENTWDWGNPEDMFGKTYLTYWDVRDTTNQIFTFKTESGSQVTWHPTDEHYFLYGTQTKNGQVCIYDLRNINKPCATFDAITPGHELPEGRSYNFDWIKKDGKEYIAFATNYGGYGYYDVQAN